MIEFYVQQSHKTTPSLNDWPSVAGVYIISLAFFHFWVTYLMHQLCDSQRKYRPTKVCLHFIFLFFFLPFVSLLENRRSLPQPNNK